ncbi:hypothetical protein EMIT07CA2_10378 [Brevibacillus sp. IT-7CA2]
MESDRNDENSWETSAGVGLFTLGVRIGVSWEIALISIPYCHPLYLISNAFNIIDLEAFSAVTLASYDLDAEIMSTISFIGSTFGIKRYPS